MSLNRNRGAYVTLRRSYITIGIRNSYQYISINMTLTMFTQIICTTAVVKVLMLITIA